MTRADLFVWMPTAHQVSQNVWETEDLDILIWFYLQKNSDGILTN